MSSTPTITQANQAGFVFALNKNTKQVEKIASTAALQIGRLNSPVELQLLGGLSLSVVTIELASGKSYNIPFQTTCVNVNPTGGGSVTLNLPVGPTSGQIIIIKDVGGSAATTNIDVTSPAGHLIDGSSTKSITTNYGFLQLIWNSSAWALTSEATSGGGAPVNAEYVVTTANGTLTNEKVLTAGSGISISSGASTVTVSATGTPPAGTNSQVQFNDGGSAFGADAEFTYDKTSDLLTVGKSEIGTVTISGTDYATFAHKDATLATGYALVQASPAGSKNTWLNAPSGGQIRFANNDTSIGYMDDNEVYLTGKSGTSTTTVLGNTAGTSAVTIDAGTGNINIGPSNSTRTINIGTTSTAANAINLLPGTTAALGTVEIAQKSTFYNKVRICDDEASTGHEVYINTGNNGSIATPITTPGNYSVTKIGTLSAESRVSLGSPTAASITTIRAGSSGMSIQAGNSDAVTPNGDIDIGTEDTYTSRTIKIGSDGDGTATKQQNVQIGTKNTSGYNIVRICDGNSYNGHEVDIVSHVYSATQSTSYSLINIGTVNALTYINIGGVSPSPGGGINTNAVKKVTIGSEYSDSFVKIRNGTGCVTMPDQPTFLVTLSSTQSNVTTSTDVKVQFDSEVFDTGNNFSTINYEFTAPVSGKYLFNVSVRVNSIDIDADYYTLYLVTSNRSYRLSLFDPGQFNADPQYWWLNGSTVADMDASDTAYVVVRQQGGAAQADIVDGVSNSFFSGWLLG